MKKKMAREGDDLEELLEETGDLEAVRAAVRKRLIADELRAAMKARKLGPAELARRMGASRQSVYRLLDARLTGATLDTLSRASDALDLEMAITFAPRARAKRSSRRAGSKKAA